MTGYWDTSCLYFRTGRKRTCCGDASGFRHLSEMVPPVAYCSSEPMVAQGKFVSFFFCKFCTLSLSELNFTHWGFCDSKLHALGVFLNFAHYVFINSMLILMTSQSNVASKIKICSTFL